MVKIEHEGEPQATRTVITWDVPLNYAEQEEWRDLLESVVQSGLELHQACAEREGQLEERVEELKQELRQAQKRIEKLTAPKRKGAK